MRALVPMLLLLASCSQEAPEPATNTNEASATEAGATEVFASGPRDRMCIKQAESRAAIITYAATGDANCSVRGAVSQPWSLAPDGDGQCRIAFAREGNAIRITEVGAACAYYCGPGATLENKVFARDDTHEAVTDLAGDPLC